MSVAGAKGGVSGGTLASGMNMFEEMAADPELRKAITADPYVLAPVDLRHGTEAARDSDARHATTDSRAGWRRS